MTVIAMADPRRLAKVHAGYLVTYAITADGELFATGMGSGCLIGDGDVADRPAPVSLGKGWASISGGHRLLALKTDGSLWGWGNNIGDGTNATRCAPTKIGDGFRTAYSPDSADGGLAVAVKQDGSLWAWLEQTSGTGFPQPLVLKQVGVETDWADAVVGYDHYLALKTDGSLWSFGPEILWFSNQRYGHLGRPVATLADITTPQRVGSNTYKALSASQYTSYAVATDGSLYGWGGNFLGGIWAALGDNGTASRSSPTLIGSGFVSVDAAPARVVALKADGSVWAWGPNGEFTPVGDGTRVERFAPVQVAAGWTTISASSSVIGLDAAGNTVGWDIYGFYRDAGSRNFGFLSSRMPVQFDYFAP